MPNQATLHAFSWTFVVTLLAASLGSTRAVNSKEHSRLASSAFLATDSTSSGRGLGLGLGLGLGTQHGTGRGKDCELCDSLLSICDSEALGRLPYWACLRASHIYGTSAVEIPHWSGARLGNDMLQVLHAIIYAEALGRPEVILPNDPTGHRGHLTELFNMPSKLTIERRPDLMRRTRCPFQASSDFFAGSLCKGVRRDDYRLALLTYFKPKLNKATKKACDSEAQGFDGLTIHLRSGDLTSSNSGHAQSRFLPCAFHDLAISSGNFKKVRVVTEPDMAHPCLEPIKRNHADKLVLVQSKSIQEDACALMTAQHLEYGDSTFAQLLEMMNENSKDVSMPKSLHGGAHDWFAAGADEDPMGMLAPCAVAPDDVGARQYNLYSVPDAQKDRKREAKTEFLLSTPASSFHSEQKCGALDANDI